MKRNPSFKLRNLNIPVVLAILLVHVMAAIAPFYFSWSALLVFLVLTPISTLSVTLCYHRLLTHRSFDTPKWFEYLLTIVTTLSWQGGPMTWVGNHRIHHKYSDMEGDPHTPNDGFSWSHLWWMLFNSPDDPRKVTLDLQRDNVMVWIDKLFWLPQVVLGIVLYYTLGLECLLWGVGLRTVCVFHFTWFVNSAAHTWGYRNFETNDNSRNLWWVAILSFGEGWHNNHHHQQSSAQHGMMPGEFDFTYQVIRFLEKVGLASKVIQPRP
ncbi:MAG: fatty acid desaturase [Candidatus Pacebacteria bacterium]|nr:fatty acid desaturase [Candidatus Paceibacterota bacterium]